MDCILSKRVISFIIFNFIFLTAYAGTPIVCDQDYALCTSAHCTPDPRNPEHAICECVVSKGKSVGYTSCLERKPTQDIYNATHLISTFSFDQFTTKKSMNCPQGTPWTNCVDMPCTVDAQFPERAICSCPIDKTQPFFTFGGNCDTQTCDTGFWSGATQSMSTELQNTLAKEVKVPEHNTCVPKT